MVWTHHLPQQCYIFMFSLLIGRDIHMAKIIRVGVDLAKNIFHVHAVDEQFDTRYF